ncbi:hypothetical protein [Clostridium sp. CF012]|uniref:hypothetical protein n=1 Tax=Clostridium sp. CF012 TaxID=2843319 RepID=UPI001C0E2459|nr:hypothetical protein [Clostridium sp. CF012]MBU3144939.1 hypothetical protein [Clostridium sp. CF012]
MYKELKLLLILLVIFIIIANNPKQAYATSLTESYKLIEVSEKDTTGDKVSDKIKILADEKNQGYVVEIVQHNGNTYRFKPSLYGSAYE